MIPAIILPELNGSPIELIKNNSEELKNWSVYGNKNLNTNAKIKTEITVAIAVVFTVMVWYVLKKYNITIAGITNKESMWTPKEKPTTKLMSNSHLKWWHGIYFTFNSTKPKTIRKSVS